MHTKIRTVDPAFEEGKNVKVAPASQTNKETKSQQNEKDKNETTQTLEKRINPDKGFLLISGGPQAIPSKPFQIHIYVQLCIFFLKRSVLYIKYFLHFIPP